MLKACEAETHSKCVLFSVLVTTSCVVCSAALEAQKRKRSWQVMGWILTGQLGVLGVGVKWQHTMCLWKELVYITERFQVCCVWTKPSEHLWLPSKSTPGFIKENHATQSLPSKLPPPLALLQSDLGLPFATCSKSLCTAHHHNSFTQPVAKFKCCRLLDNKVAAKQIFYEIKYFWTFSKRIYLKYVYSTSLGDQNSLN